MHTSVESEAGFMLLSLFQSGKSTSVAFKVARDIPQRSCLPRNMVTNTDKPK